MGGESLTEMKEGSLTENNCRLKASRLTATGPPAATGKLLTETLVQINQFKGKSQKNEVQFSKRERVIFQSFNSWMVLYFSGDKEA